MAVTFTVWCEAETLKRGAKYYNDLTDEHRATLDAVNLTRTTLKSILGSETDAKRIIDNRSYLGYDEIKKSCERARQ